MNQTKHSESRINIQLVVDPDSPEPDTIILRLLPGNAE